MGADPSWLRRVQHELRRRSVWQALGIYAAACWAVLQVVDQLVERLGLPDWTYGFALVLVLLGLPIILATAAAQAGEAPADTRPGAASSENAGPTHGPAGGGARAVRRGMRRWLTRRNAIFGGVAALALSGVIAAGWLALGRSPMAVSAPGSTRRGAPGQAGSGADGIAARAVASRVAVMPFAVYGSGEYDFLREGMVDLLSTRLDHGGDLRAVDSHALLSALERAPPGGLSPAAARELGERFGAGLVLLGNVVEVQGRLRLNATLYDFAGGGTAWEAAAEGAAGSLFELVDTVAAQILGGLGRGPGARVRRTAALTTGSLAALKAYLQGDAALRAGRFEEAYDAYTRAAGEDSLFALAHYRRSIAAEWTTRFDEAVHAAEAAVRHSARLSERDRRQLEAFMAYRRGAFADAERRYRAIVGRYPDDVEAWNHLAETLFHYGPLHGRSFREARAAFERVLAYDTFRGAAIVHLARIAAAERRTGELDSLVVAFLETNPEGDRELELLAMQAWARDDPALQRRVLERLRGANDQLHGFVAWDLATFQNRPAAALEVAGLLTSPDHPAEARSYGHAVRASLLLGLGRWREAQAALDAAEAIEPAAGLEHRALFTLSPALSPDREELAGLRDRLLRLDTASIPRARNPIGFFSVHDDVHHLIVPFLLGVIQARLGEETAALRLADALETLPVPPGRGSAPGDFAWTVRAEAHRAAGRPAEALAALDHVRLEGWYSHIVASPFLARTHTRFLRAELLTEQGRGGEALGLYRGMVESATHDVAYAGIQHLRRAGILNALGRVDEAARERGLAEATWRDADPYFRSLLAGEGRVTGQP